MWFEILKIRTKSADASPAGAFLLELLSGGDMPAELNRYRLFYSGTHANEVMLTLCWDSAGPQTGGSDLGNRLAYSLKQFGLVELSVWSGEAEPR